LAISVTNPTFAAAFEKLIKMGNLKEFSIPIKGLKKGIHEFDFHITDDFFKNFEGSPIQQADFNVHLVFDKHDSFFDLSFEYEGVINTECDRCTANIQLPYGDKQSLRVKLSLEEHEEDADIVFIHPESSELTVAQFIYEFICLSMPFHKVYDCENDDPRPCDFDILNKINNTPSVEIDFLDVTDDKKNPFTDLKKFFEN
jgi:uncharacterized protein